MMKNYNTTQLNPENCFERHVFHRDQVGHWLRWSHALRRLEINMNVLDFGCGSGNMAEVMYRNRYKGNLYLGLDIRKQTIEKNQENFKDVSWVQFAQADLTSPDLDIPKHDWNLITCFEVAEHVGKQRVPQLLENIAKQMGPETLLMISTPVFDSQVGAADNHTYDSGDGCGVAIHEMTKEEFQTMLEARFTVQERFGVFASVKDYKDHLEEYPGLTKVYDRLKKYFDWLLSSQIKAGTSCGRSS
jgi:2-polyprenyl-3-methyl-5-hydroxy-6-metoxy-1,4-benzoquinol methylase